MKLRPALIVSSAQFNQGSDIVVVPLSSAPDANDRWSYHLGRGHRAFAQSGLKFESAVKFTKLTTLAKSLVTRRIGHVDEQTLEEIRSLIVPILSKSKNPN
jgi:mRNA-degrading endonuclease toxin of MazEF toxin-antitoxin module